MKLLADVGWVGGRKVQGKILLTFCNQITATQAKKN
jgi:hypothetical protein